MSKKHPRRNSWSAFAWRHLARSFGRFAFPTSSGNGYLTYPGLLRGPMLHRAPSVRSASLSGCGLCSIRAVPSPAGRHNSIPGGYTIRRGRKKPEPRLLQTRVRLLVWCDALIVRQSRMMPQGPASPNENLIEKCSSRFWQSHHDSECQTIAQSAQVVKSKFNFHANLPQNRLQSISTNS